MASINDLRVLADTLAKRCISDKASLAIEDLNFAKKEGKDYEA